MRIITLCTGNAARSVMAGAMLERHRPDIEIITAGTHVIDGQPMSWRTRDALTDVGLEADHHRSAQLRSADLADVTLILAMAGEHVAWMRRTHESAVDRTITVKRLVRDLDPGPDFAHRLALLEPATTDLEPWEDVEDPAGGTPEDYVACARQLNDLIDRLVPLL